MVNIGLSSVLRTISAFCTVAVYGADNVSQIVNLKAKIDI